jgi:hypothetical protein
MSTLSAEESEEPLLSCSEHNWRKRKRGTLFLTLCRTLIDVDPAVTTDEEIQTATCSLPKDQHLDQGLKQEGSYRRYTADQIEKLFDLVIEEGKTAKEATSDHWYQYRNCLTLPKVI